MHASASATWTKGKAVLRSTDQAASPRRTRPHHDHRYSALISPPASAAISSSPGETK